MGVPRDTPRNVSTDIHRGTVGEGGTGRERLIFATFLSFHV